MVNKFSWAFLEDPHMPELGRHAIAPWFGFMVRMDLTLARLPWWLGFFSGNLTTYSTLTIKHAPHNKENTGIVPTSLILSIRNTRRVLQILDKALPLWFLIVICRRRLHIKHSIPEIIAALYVVLGRNDKNTCLIDSLIRFYFLHGKSNITLNIGAFVPTQLMHAWVEIDSIALHECPDRLIHFSKAVSYLA